jgi:hypothetical protein
VIARRSRRVARDLVLALIQLAGLLALEAAGLPFLLAFAGVIAGTLLALAAAGRLASSGGRHLRG